MIQDIDSAPSFHEKDTVDRIHEYREHLREDAENFLLHSALKELLVASEAEGRLSTKELEELATVQDDHSRYMPLAAKLVQKAMNWRTHNHMERHQLKDDDLSPEFRETIKRVGSELGMTNEVPIPDDDFEVAVVLGATVKPVAERTDYLYDALENGNSRAEILLGLGAERPMLAPDINNAKAYPYVEQSEVETNLLSFAAQDWFIRHGYDMPSVDPSTPSISWLRDRNYDSKYRYQTVSFEGDQNRPDWAPETIVNISAPYQKDHHPRANTGETIEFMVKLANIQSGDKALFISHQPYLLGQRFEIERLCLEPDIRVSVAGYESRNPNLPATVWGGEIAKAATKASELLAALHDAQESNQPVATRLQA